MNILKAILEANTHFPSPIVLTLKHSHTTADVLEASRKRESLDDDNVLTFTLDQQMFSYNSSNLPQRVRWDGRPDANGNYELKVIPLGAIYLDNTDYYLAVPAVAVAKFETPGPMLFQKPNHNKFSVDKIGITDGIPVTLFVDTAQKRAMVLNYGLSDNLIQNGIAEDMFANLQEDVIPGCCTPVISMSDLPILWDEDDSEEEPDARQDPPAPSADSRRRGRGVA